MTNIYSDGNPKEWNGTAERGSWVYMSKNRDKERKRAGSGRNDES